MAKIVLIDRTSNNVTLTGGTAYNGSNDPTGFAKSGDTIYTAKAAYYVYASLAAGDTISYNRAQWHDPSVKGWKGGDQGSANRLIVPGANHIEKNGFVVCSYGSNSENDQWARIDQGTWLTSADDWTLLDDQPSNSAVRQLAGSFRPGTWYASWVPGVVIKGETGSTTNRTIQRLFRDAVNTGYGVTQRTTGRSLRRYETDWERAKSQAGISGMGLAVAQGGTKGVWASARYPCVGDVADWGVTNKDVANKSSTRVYLFVYTGKPSGGPSLPPSHATTLNGVYITNPINDAWGILFRGTSGGFTSSNGNRGGGLCKDIWVMGCNSSAFACESTSAKAASNVRFVNVKATHCAQAVLGFGGGTQSKPYIHDFSSGLYSVDGFVCDTKWDAETEAYDFYTTTGGLNPRDKNIQNAWETSGVRGHYTGIALRGIEVIGTSWHSAWSLPAATFSDKTYWPAHDLVVTDCTLECAPGLGDSRISSVGAVERWVQRNMTCSGHIQKNHTGGSQGLIENSVFKKPGGAGTIKGETGEVVAIWDLAQFGQVEHYTDSGSPLAVPNLMKNIVWRHNVIDDRLPPKGRVAIWMLVGTAAQKMPTNGLTIYNNIIIVPAVHQATLNNATGKSGTYYGTHLVSYSTSGIGADAWTTSACGFNKHIFRNNWILVDRSTAGNESSAVRAAWRSLCFLNSNTSGQAIPLTRGFKALLDSAFAGRTKPYQSGYVWMFDDGTNADDGNRVMWLQDANIDYTSTYQLGTSSPILKSGAHRNINAHHDAWKVDRSGKIRKGVGSLTTDAAWATSRLYTVGAMVKQGGVRYYCETQHTSGTFATDLAAGKWVVNNYPTPGIFEAVAVFTNTDPLPEITTISPTTLTSGESATVPLTVYGTGFIGGDEIEYGGVVKDTTLIPGSPAVPPEAAVEARLQCDVIPDDYATAGLVEIRVVANRGNSAYRTLTIIPGETPQAPEIVSISPGTVSVAPADPPEAPINITISGLHFAVNQEIRVTGFATLVPTGYTTSDGVEYLTFSLPSSYRLTEGTREITVYDAAGGISNSATLTVEGTVVQVTPPVLTSMNPTGATAGDPAFPLHCYGSDIEEGVIIRFNGDEVVGTTNWVDSTHVWREILADKIDQAGTVNVRLKNTRGPGNNSAATLSFVIGSPPVPVIESLDPATVTQSTKNNAPVTMRGSNFTRSAQVKVGGTNRTTVFVSSSRLDFTITKTDRTTVADLAVTLVDTGGTVGPVLLPVVEEVVPPVITSLSRYTAEIGETPFPLTITGAGFASDQTLKVNEEVRAHTHVSGTSKTYPVAADDLAAEGALTFVIDDPDLPDSNSTAFQIVKPTVVVDPDPENRRNPKRFFIRTSIAPVAVLVVPASPVVYAGSATATTLDVFWGGVPGATGYTVYYGTDGVTFPDSVTVPDEFVTLTGLTAATTYYIKAIASNSAGNSAASDVLLWETTE